MNYLIKFRFKQVFQNGFDIHHNTISQIINSYALSLKRNGTEFIPGTNSWNSIELNEFFRNNLSIVLLGYLITIIFFILEVTLFFYYHNNYK